MRFLGNIEAKIDAKGRVLPSAMLRKVLQVAGEESLVLRKNASQSYLAFYPESVWSAQLDILRRHLSRWNAQEQLIFRQFISDVKLLSLDANGCLLMPKRYLKMTNIERAVEFTGMDDTIEMWCSDVTEKSFMQSGEFGKTLQEIMSEGVEPIKETE